MPSRSMTDIRFGLRRAVTVDFGTILVVALVFLLLGIMTLLLENFRKYDREVRSRIGFEIFLRDDATADELYRLGIALAGIKDVVGIEYRDKSDVFEEMRRMLGNEMLPDIEDNPFPNSITVKLTPGDVSLKNLRLLTSELSGLRCVEKTSFNEEWLETQEPILDFLDMLSTFLALLVFAAAVIIIFWAAGRSVSIKREEIAILKSAGAGWKHLGFPFMLEGATVGLLGAILALVALFVVWYYAQKLPFGIDFISSYSIIAIPLVGFFSGLTAAHFAVRRTPR